MAYLDHSNIGAASFGEQVARPSRTATAKTGFSPLEWSVVALARRDNLRSLTTPSPLSRAMGSLFGLGVASPLADPRLEALRRIAVYAWRRGFALPLAEIRRFRSAGFSDAQLETLVRSVTGVDAQPEAVTA